MFALKIQPDTIAAYKGKTVLITGGMGYIGSALTEAFCGIECNLKIMCSPSGSVWKPKNGKANVSVFHGDVSQRHLWEPILDGVDYVFHLASVEGDYDIKHEIAVNSMSMLYLLDVCHENELRPKIVYSSSANIFGLTKTNFVDETFSDNPVSTWSAHKLLAEQYLRVYNKKCDLKSVILRLSNVYGPVPNKKVVKRVIINKIIHNALTGKALTLYKNQYCVRDYIFIDDVIRAFLLAGNINENISNAKSYVIGSSKGVRIADVWKLIAKKVFDITRKKIKIELDESVQLEPMEMRNFISNTSAFNKDSRWKASVDLVEGIDYTVNSLLADFNL